MNVLVFQLKGKCLLSLILCFYTVSLKAQTDSLLDIIPADKPGIEYVTGAFKSSRVVNNQSMEMIGKGVLDLRILHRFGLLNEGISNFFGLDQASFRLGFDYGITNNFTIGVGRSTFQKELDGSLKWRIIQQSKGTNAFPLSVLLVGGVTVNTTPEPSGQHKRSISDRTGYFYEVIIGRKFNDVFSLQLNPTGVHRNRILPSAADDKNDVFAIGTGFRLRISRRISFIADYDYIFYGLNKDVYKNPLAIGFDIETGGHVFQLHFSNSEGLNDNAFLTHTTREWGRGEINFGFNLSRIFNIRPKQIK